MSESQSLDEVFGPKQDVAVAPITHQELVDASEDFLLNRYVGLKTIGDVVLARRNLVQISPEALEAIEDELASDPDVVRRRDEYLVRRQGLDG